MEINWWRFVALENENHDGRRTSKSKWGPSKNKYPKKIVRCKWFGALSTWHKLVFSIWNREKNYRGQVAALHEIIYLWKLKKSGKKSYADMKRDMSKLDFDRVRLVFFFFFPSSLSLSHPRRGIRQGDPLSSFTF